MKRKQPFIAVFVVSAIALFSGLPPASASLYESQEIYYFNYGSQFPDGSEGYTCTGYYWQQGDRTPQNGELKVIEVMNCNTYESVFTWYRYSDPGCTTPMWQWIPEPEYWREWYC